jgi:hypothetical protein
VRRIIAAALLAVIASLGINGLRSPEPAPASESAGGTWFCLAIEQVRGGWCLEDPLP